MPCRPSRRARSRDRSRGGSVYASPRIFGTLRLAERRSSAIPAPARCQSAGSRLPCRAHQQSDSALGGRGVFALGLGHLAVAELPTIYHHTGNVKIGKLVKIVLVRLPQKAYPVRPLIERFRPLRGWRRAPVRAHRVRAPKYLIRTVLSGELGVNLRAQSIIHPVFRVLQGSGHHRGFVTASWVTGTRGRQMW